ncbi:MAG: hypothetical protein U0W24_10255 [Bacteroidales bacterium]
MRSLSQITIALTLIVCTIFSLRYQWKNNLLNPVTPPHGPNFNISCNVCHSTDSWKLDKEHYSFNHDSTAMPLKGQHTQVNCRSCHPTLIFSEAKTECNECHTDMHESTVGKDCSRCHNAFSWLVNNITQIHQQSRFPLVGVHANVDCNSCHLSETLFRFDVIGTECYSCHRDKYESATEPNHITAGFSTVCNDCHSIFAKEWNEAGFNHSIFPLTQGHAIGDCSLCHINGDYSNTSPDCISCHQNDFNSTTNPNHSEAGFSTDCKTCHTTAPGWKPASFDHTLFPLTLGHAIDDCTKCHINGNYSNTSNVCVSCHQNDYNNTTNPQHSTLGFSTNCQDCHTTDPGWKPAKYTQHDALSFPIYSGKHKGEWSACSECHPNASNYKVISCIDCHAHNKNEMDDKHKDEQDYIYSSDACLNCHPNGSANK